MTFSIGETVVYPNHGTAVIEDIENRTIKGEDKLFLVLRVIGQNDLVIKVPAHNLDLVGVRDVVDADGLEKVFAVLRAEHTEEPANWSRRFKANMEKLHSGNVIKVSEVVRDLWRRDRDKGLSAGEKRMLAKARSILVSELALAERVDEEKAEILLDEVLAGGGEGLMLHRADALWQPGRSEALRKLTPWLDAEARVVGYLPGKGRLQGRVGALRVETADGRRFRIGSGLSDALRANPPALGALVTYRYRELTPAGLPRFPRYLRERTLP